MSSHSTGAACGKVEKESATLKASKVEQRAF